MANSSHYGQIEADYVTPKTRHLADFFRIATTVINKAEAARNCSWAGLLGLSLGVTSQSRASGLVLGRWQSEIEYGSAERVGVVIDLAAMSVDQRAADREAQSQAVFTRRLKGLE